MKKKIKVELFVLVDESEVGGKKAFDKYKKEVIRNLKVRFPGNGNFSVNSWKVVGVGKEIK